jgi:uncharacterized protein DUF4112
MSDPGIRVSAPLIGILEPARIERLRSLSRLLDVAVRIPGTDFRFGLDALIGLVPGLGDAVGAAFSGYIILQAARLRAPKSTLTRMIVNVALDTILGAIPLLGDLFDMGWKSNMRNVALLEEHLRQPVAARAGSRRSLLLLGGALVVLFVGALALGVALTKIVVVHLW